MMDPDNPTWFLMVSVPACKTVSFKFLIIRANGSVTWERGRNHTHAVPCTGTGTTDYDWQQ
jgi:hypothetical protein